MNGSNRNTFRRDFLKTLSLSVPIVGTTVICGTGRVFGEGKPLPRNYSMSDSLYYDVLVYGAASAGVITAYSAKMYGLSVLLVEPGRHLGGMSSGGLGRTDTGNEGAITAFPKNFIYDWANIMD